MKRLFIQKFFNLITVIFTFSALVLSFKYDSPVLFACFLLGGFMSIVWISICQDHNDKIKHISTTEAISMDISEGLI